MNKLKFKKFSKKINENDKTKTERKNKIAISVTAGIVAILITSTFIIQFKSVDKYKESGIENLRQDELKTQISSYQSKYNEASEQYEENENKIKEYTSTATENEKSDEILDSELQESKQLLGLTDVRGEGIVITLQDTDDAKYTSENLRYLINELKYAGAEAISINDNRIINLIDIVTVNDQFIVINNVRISSPYVVKVIGDTKYLTSTLNMKNSGFVDLMKSNNLSVDVKEEKSVTIYKYTSEIKSDYIKEEE